MRGFTLLEVMVVIALSCMILALSLVVSLDTYRSAAFVNDRALLIALLQHARAQALNNVCLGNCTDGVPHGVHIDQDAYTVFQGASYNPSDSNNARFESNTAIVKSGISDVIFSQLSATTSTTGDVILSFADSVSTTTILSNGAIVWTR
ncbi:prepilin-type N-terminal cleavage/methylation domain-containing protein [bacterium]|nr:prepilin-type N-terminal cleavage/methylation domain-containing protein [bacterium]